METNRWVQAKFSVQLNAAIMLSIEDGPGVILHTPLELLDSVKALQLVIDDLVVVQYDSDVLKAIKRLLVSCEVTFNETLPEKGRKPVLVECQEESGKIWLLTTSGGILERIRKLEENQRVRVDIMIDRPLTLTFTGEILNLHP